MIADLEPYPEYKESGLPWLGRVPGHWEVRPAFGAFVQNHERNHGMKEKIVLSLSYGRIVIKPAEKLHGLVPESFETYQIVNPGDIVIRTTDLQNDHTSQRVGWCETEESSRPPTWLYVRSLESIRNSASNFSMSGTPAKRSTVMDRVFARTLTFHISKECLSQSLRPRSRL